VPKWILIVIAILATLFRTDLCHAELVDTVKVKLNQRDKSRIEELACLKSHAVNAGSIRSTRARGQRTIEVEVECKPHAAEDGYPVAYFTSCDNYIGIWTCEPGHAALEIDSQIGRILLHANASVDIKLSLEILRFVLTQKSFHDTPVLPALSQMTPNIWTISSLSADSWLIDGSLFKMTVARECRDSNCNFRITDFSEALV
jgi:hypothetical protein